MHTLDPLRLPHPVGSNLLYVPIVWEDTDLDYAGAVDLDHLASSRCLNDSSFLPPVEGFRERNSLCPFLSLLGTETLSPKGNRVKIYNLYRHSVFYTCCTGADRTDQNKAKNNGTENPNNNSKYNNNKRIKKNTNK